MKGAGNTGVKGIMVAHEAKTAGDIVDVMSAGELVATDEAWTSGTNYTVATADGALGVTAADATHIGVGFTVEAGRMVVGKHV